MGHPGIGFTKLIESCQIGGVDMTSLVDKERKNIDALIEVNRSAYESWRNLVAQQARVFQETMRAIAAEALDETVAGRRAEIARQGFEKALANMRQSSLRKSLEILRRRFEEGITAMRNRGGST